MYKDGILNLVPIILGLVIGFICGKFTSRKTIYSFIISIIISMGYLAVITFYTSSKNETQLLVILFIWNSTLIFILNKIYLYFYQKRNA